MDIKQAIIDAVDVVEFIKEQLQQDWSGNEQDKLTCPMASTRHEDGDDSSHSLSINPNNGAFNCFGCGWKGTSIVGMYTDLVCNGNFKQALAKLYSRYVSEPISEKAVQNYHTYLLKRPTLQQKIAAIRGWSKETIELLGIGWDSEAKRTVLPIFNLDGVILDVRRHDTLYRAPLVKGKRVPCIGNSKSRTGDWYPLSPSINPFTNDDDIWLLEGEPDVVLGTQEGLNCITLTGGAGAWKAIDHEKLKVFHGKNVIICLDADKAGQEAAKVLAQALIPVGLHSLKNVPVPQGKDLTDFFLKHGGSVSQIKQIAKATDWLIKPKSKNAHTIPLSETSRAEFIGKSVKTSLIVSGKADAPQAIPQRLKLTCRTDEYCANCPCKITGEADYFVEANDPNSLEWLYIRDYASQVKRETNLAKSCKMSADVIEWQNLEQVICIPSLSISKSADDGNYSTRRGYFIGHGIESNANYEVTCVPTVHPKTKESVLLIENAVGTYDSIDSFQLTDNDIKRLKEIFCDDPKQTLNDVASMLANNHTKIYGRNDVHIAVDLAFHSPRDFTFADTVLPKGSIELLLFGDTRCGKGQIAEGLVRYYDLGAVVSGENASFMGLCGGAQKAGDSFTLSWGAIPINNGRLVVIDEFSGLSEDVLGRLSRVRSEGIAEINKGGINSRTRANARMVWVANPNKGREVASYANGVTAIMELVKTNEDVARFDLAVVVQKGEVDVATINQASHAKLESKYTQQDLRKVVLWVWSRKAEQVIFTSQAVSYILKAANRLAGMYSPIIPLIQGENARFKIAKIAAAIAGRCFSTPDGSLLKVEEIHAKLAVQIINHFYSKPSMGYRQFSEVEIDTGQLSEVDSLKQFFLQFHDKTTIKLIIDGLMSAAKFGVREMQDWCDVDATIAKKFIGLFVRCQAARQLSQGLYIKKPAFIYFLKSLKKEIDNG